LNLLQVVAAKRETLTDTKKGEKMKRLMAICLVCAVVFGLSNWVSAEQISQPMKWTQTPDMETGLDWGSMRGWYIAADDYLCENSLPVTDVHWWGSYWNPYPGSPLPINGFTISFYSNVPADGEFSHPGDLLHQTYINGNCNETYYGYSAYDNTNVYQYGTILPEPFEQVPGTVYWLSIVVDQGWETTPPNWGWHNSSDHWTDSAVQWFPSRQRFVCSDLAL
jgi:hypothetical protein